MNLYAERLAQVLDMLNDERGLRCCEHTVLMHHAGLGLAICAPHADLGLHCEACAETHDATAHRADVCAFCSFPIEPGGYYARSPILDMATRVHPPGVASRDDADPVVLLFPTIAVFVLPCCVHPRCRERADREIANVEAVSRLATSD